MGDAPFITFLSMVPLIIIFILIVAAVIAWRSRNRAVRIVVALILILLGTTFLFSPAIGVLFSIAGSAFICLIGVILLFSAMITKSAT
jgi:hypothetical protein